MLGAKVCFFRKIEKFLYEIVENRELTNNTNGEKEKVDITIYF